MSKAFGIDLGTTNSAIAEVNNYGQPVVLRNEYDGVDTLSSVVYMYPGEKPIVGQTAKEYLKETDKRKYVIECVKRFIGKVERPSYMSEGSDIGPIGVSALILDRIVEYAKDQGRTVEDVVITCPAYFKAAERAAIRQAAKASKLNVLTIIDEPTAAAINFCHKEYLENRRILVYDLGGGTFDVSLLDMTVTQKSTGKNFLVKVLGIEGDDHLGGADWDKKLTQLMISNFIQTLNLSEDTLTVDTQYEIELQAEKVKKDLTGRPEATFTANHAGKMITSRVTRQDFEDVTQNLLSNANGLVDNLLSRMKKEKNILKDSIDLVLLVGGSTLMPMVRTSVEELFPGKVQIEEPHLAVAKGAALVANKKYSEINQTEDNSNSSDNSSPSFEFEDVVSYTLGVGIWRKETDEYLIDNLVYAEDKAGTEYTGNYETAADYTSSLRFQIYQSSCRVRKDKTTQKKFYLKRYPDGRPLESEARYEVKMISEFNISVPDDEKEGYPLTVTFRVDSNGINVIVNHKRASEPYEHFVPLNGILSQKELSDMTEIISELTSRST